MGMLPYSHLYPLQLQRGVPLHRKRNLEAHVDNFSTYIDCNDNPCLWQGIVSSTKSVIIYTLKNKLAVSL